MPVTDLTESLPWWAQQGGAPGGQQPPGSSQGWLQYLSQMYGISPQQAATMMQSGGNPADMPSADASNMVADAPVVRPGPGAANPPFQLPGATAALPSGTTMPPTQPPAPLQQQGPPGYLNSTSAVPPIQPPTPPNPTTMPARPASGMGLPPGGLSSAVLGAYNNMPWPSGGGGIQNIQNAYPNPDAPAANAQPVAATPGPLANPGGAGGMGAASNPRFAEIDRPNADPIGSAQGRGGPPRMTALNLAGLFGGGPQGGPAAAPAGGGPVRGPLAGGVTQDDLYPAAAARRGMTTNAPWNYGPLQQRNIWRSSGGPRPRPTGG
jgi:hypothetical protein